MMWERSLQGSYKTGVVTGRILPESQCGFRKWRGCVDMIFTARQLVEKSREHDDLLYIYPLCVSQVGL